MKTLDDLELELRKLPSVRAAGFDQRDDLLFVQVHVDASDSSAGLAFQATRLAAQHTDRPVAVEVVRRVSAQGNPGSNGTTAPARSSVDLTATENEAAREPRVRLLAVLSFPDTNEIEVHLTLRSKRTIGRAEASTGLLAGVDATLDALRGFLPDLMLSPVWARSVESERDRGPLVAVGVNHRHALRRGIAGGEDEAEAAARATLDALNRILAPDLAEQI